MVNDALREALYATRDAWQAVNDELDSADADLKAAVLGRVDNAQIELEDALILAAMSVPE